MFPTPARQNGVQLTGNRALFSIAAMVLMASILLLGSAVSQAGHAERLYRNFCLVAIAGLGLAVSFLRAKPSETSPLDRLLDLCGILLPCYALLQIIPLP